MWNHFSKRNFMWKSPIYKRDKVKLFWVNRVPLVPPYHRETVTQSEEVSCTRSRNELWTSFLEKLYQHLYTIPTQELCRAAWVRICLAWKWLTLNASLLHRWLHQGFPMTHLLAFSHLPPAPSTTVRSAGWWVIFWDSGFSWAMSVTFIWILNEPHPLIYLRRQSLVKW